ncbi:MAG: hemerythrin domain-containing protein [Chitinophagaceae bacterium]|nr:hemerythrin domain-containing protein [Chitinophagaceae bacterium]
MQRLNIFNKAHKALRGLFCTTLIQLQQTDPTRLNELVPCISQIRLLLELLEQHALLEDNHILPLLEPNGASISTFFANQHVQDEILSTNLKCTLNSLEKENTKEEQLHLGQKLMLQFIDFTVFNLDHMNMEEQLINPFLWSAYPDAVLENKITEAIRASPPVHHEIFLDLMIQHQNKSEVQAKPTSDE